MISRLNNGMIDWLEIVNKMGGEAVWVSQQRNFPKRTDKRENTKDLNQLIEMILKTKSVQKAIKEECVKRHTTSKLLCDEARLILRNIAHQMQMPVVRSVGYMLAKIIKTVYDGVYFNDEQLLRIREYSTNNPIIFMPTHRSYMDFLILSILCFNHNVSLPVIATGMDFMASKFLGETLRRCGSFFMKRKFGKDNLYWSLFTSYVQMQLIEMDNPIEFFLEGARSRSGKSLYPKSGFLQMCIEPFLQFKLFDLIVVPITINYDKVLEESLYAYELFGLPKPKETTTGLLKAREILGKRFGHIYVNFGEPISIRKYCNGRIDRWCPPWQLNEDNKLSDEKKELIKDFALHIIRIHNSNSTVTVWPYTCAILLQIFGEGCRKLVFNKLRSFLEDFVALAVKMGRKVMVKESIADDLKYHIKLHAELFVNFDERLFDNSMMELRRFECTKNVGSMKDYIEEVLCEVILSHYANQMMHDFVDLSLLCCVLLSKQALSEVRNTFRKLRLLFVYEFVCSSKEEEINDLFAQNLNCLMQIAAISVTDDCITLKEEQILKQVAYLMQPFIIRYYCLMQSLVHLTGIQFSDKMLFEESLRRVVNLHIKQRRNRTHQTICITLDVVRNALLAFCSLQAVSKSSETQYDIANVHRLQALRELLESITLNKLPFDDRFIVSKI